jgi:hypothetical protein
MLDKTQAEQIQDPELADVGEEEEAKAEDVGLADPGLDVQLGLDPAAPFQPVLPPLPLQPPQPPPPPHQHSPPPSPPPRPLPLTMSAVQANGNQIALLPTVDVEAGADVDMWIAVFLRMARQFHWIDPVITAAQDAQLALVAKNKLIWKAAFWSTRRGRRSQDRTIGNCPGQPERRSSHTNQWHRSQGRPNGNVQVGH